MPNNNRWTANDLRDLSGKVIVVTGGNSGIGYEAALQFARKRARVVLACRDLGKARIAVDQIKAASPDAELDAMQLDLANLASVRGFTDAFHIQHRKLDVLCNNAGVMALPYRQTVDGFEMQFGTNHLGHFALTGRLMATLLAASEPRVVTLSSGAHRMGTINFDDLQRERRYNNWLAYGQSKLANLIFAFELQRRASAAGTNLLSLAAHPGYSATNLQFAGPAAFYEKAFMAVANKVYAQSADMGALPTLYAATMPDVPGGSFIGPDGFMEGRGHPKIVTGAGKAYDEDTGRRLWEASEELTGVHYEFAATAAA